MSGATHFVHSLLALLLLACRARGQGGDEFTSWVFPSGLSCPQVSLGQLASAGAGRDVSAALSALNSASKPPGMVFVPPGVFSVQKSVELNKPVVMPPGAVFSLASGATLSLRQPLNAGPWQVFSGDGSVRFKSNAGLRLLPEWFGATGDGVNDDAPAINWAMQAANDSGADVQFSAGRLYAVGSTVNKPGGMRVFSQPGATLKALSPGLVGILYQTGNHLRQDVLPSLIGFATGVEYLDVGMVDSYAPFIGPAPGLPCQAGLRVNADSVRIKFGTIQNCETGVLVTTRTNVRTVMQGVTINGEAFIDTAGVGKQAYLFAAKDPSNPPYWDHGLYSLDSVQPSPAARGFAVVRSNVRDTDRTLPYLTFELGTLGALPPGGKFLDSPMSMTVARLAPQAPFADGSLDYSGGFLTLNAFFFEGPAAQPGSPLTLATATNSIAAFKATNGLSVTPWQNVLSVTTPGGAWQAGDTRQLYLYHQLAFEGQLLYINVPGWGSRCIDGKLAVTAATDNSQTGSKYEVVLQVVACTAFTGPVTFPLALGAPST